VLTPDITYSFRRAKDVSGPTFEILCRRLSSATAAAAQTVVISDLAKDKMLVLSNVSLVGIPGATQGVTNMSFSGVTPGGLIFAIARFNEALVADLNRQLSWAGTIYLTGGGAGVDILTFTANFDAGAASNQILVGVHGVVIPKANAGPF